MKPSSFPNSSRIPNLSQFGRLVACAIVAVLGHTSARGAESAPATAQPISIELFAPNASEATAAALGVALTEGSQKMTVHRAATAGEMIGSKADVLVLMATRDELEVIGKIPIEKLKGRKILGIGYGAAHLFEALGLTISGGHCAHGVPGVPRLLVPKGVPLKHPPAEETFNLFEPPILDAKDFHNKIVFGIYIGNKHPEIRAAIDVLATFTNSPDYAPIARQGSAILIGVEGQTESWSTPLRAFVRDLVAELRDTP